MNRPLVRGTDVRPRGSKLPTAGSRSRAVDVSALVTDQRRLATGDALAEMLWRTVDADPRATADRTGAIGMPRVSTLRISGVHDAGLVRGVGVFASRPDVCNVSYVSRSVTSLVGSGGTWAAARLRSIEVQHGFEVARPVDHYAQLVMGSHGDERALQTGDLACIGPGEAQLAVFESVGRPVVCEFVAGEQVAEEVSMAGAFSAITNSIRLAFDGLAARAAERVERIGLPVGKERTLGHGRTPRPSSDADEVWPTQPRAQRVRIEVVVQRACDCVPSEDSTLRNIVRLAGGFGRSAFVCTTEFGSASLELTGRENFDQALRDLDAELARSLTLRRTRGGEDAVALTVRGGSSTQIIDRQGAVQAARRVGLILNPEDRTRPEPALEDGARAFVLARPTAVGIFGRVFGVATYLHLPHRDQSDYLHLAGGPPKGANERRTLLARANGCVMSDRRRNTEWFRAAAALGDLHCKPRDTILVPDEFKKATVVQNLMDLTLVFSQFSLGLAAIRILGN